MSEKHNRFHSGRLTLELRLIDQKVDLIFWDEMKLITELLYNYYHY